MGTEGSVHNIVQSDLYFLIPRVDKKTVLGGVEKRNTLAFYLHGSELNSVGKLERQNLLAG